MAKQKKRKKSTIQIKDLDTAIGQTLTLYHEDVNFAIDAAAKQTLNVLVKKTKATAPKGVRKRYHKNIAGKLLKKNRNGSTYVWYVKAPDYRLTHLLVKPHATIDGGSTRPNPFLKNALDEELPKYVKEIEEALKNGK